MSKPRAAELFYTRRVIGLPTSLTRTIERGGRGLSVLAIRLGALGDVLRTVPAVRLIRRGLPEARIVWAVEEHWRIVLDEHPDLDAIVPLPRKQWDRWSARWTDWPRLAGSLWKVRHALRAVGADLAVDFHGNLRSGVVARLSGAPVRLGYAGHQQKEGNRRFTTHRVPSGDRRTPRMERNLDLVRALGLPARPLPDGGLHMVAVGREQARRILREQSDGANLIVVSPGASPAQAYKRPPLALLVAACRAAHRRGAIALVVFGPGEEDDARRLTQAAGDAARLAPSTPLPVLAALLSEARLFVGGDSGPLHLACAVGCPVLGLYGPTDPRVNLPWGVPHEALAPPQREYTGIKRIDRESGGFAGLEPAHVAAAVERMLAAPRGSVLSTG